MAEGSPKSELAASAVSSAMSDKRREKLLALRRYEQMKGVLVRKFGERYGSGGRSASCGKCPQSVIRAEVDDFLKNAAISERNLDRLERRIQKLAADKQDEEMSLVSNYTLGAARSCVSKSGSRVTGSTSSSGMSALSKSLPGTQSLSNLKSIREEQSCVESCLSSNIPVSKGFKGCRSAALLRSQASSRTKSSLSAASKLMSKTCAGFSASSDDDSTLDRPRRPKRTTPFSWSTLDDYAAYEKEKQAQELRQRCRQGQTELRAELDKQVSDARVKNERRREEDQRYFRNQVMELEAFKEQETAKVQHRREIMARDADAKRNQLKMTEQRKKDEEERRLADEVVMVTQIQREAEMDKQKKLNMKKSRADHMQQMLAADEAERERKELERQRERQEECDNMRVYNRMLDEQEKQRGAEARASAEKQKSLMMMMDADLIVGQEARGKEVDRRARKQAKELSERAAAQEREKFEKLKERNRETQEYQLHQMAEKAEKKKTVLMSKEVQMHMLAEDATEFSRREAEVAQRNREKNIQNRKALESQIATKSADDTQMTEREIEINRDLIDRVEASGLLVNK